MRVSANTGNPKTQRFSQNLWIHLFFGFHFFFWIFGVESKKSLGNVWILLLSLVKIIIFSRIYMDFVAKSTKNLGNTMMSTSDTNKHQTFPRQFLDFTTTSKKIENIMILTSDISKIQTFPRVFLDSTKKIQKNQKNKRTQRFSEHLWILGFWDFCNIRQYASPSSGSNQNTIQPNIAQALSWVYTFRELLFCFV